jgi:hypothetical protein
MFKEMRYFGFIDTSQLLMTGGIWADDIRLINYSTSVTFH